MIEIGSCSYGDCKVLSLLSASSFSISLLHMPGVTLNVDGSGVFSVFMISLLLSRNFIFFLI